MSAPGSTGPRTARPATGPFARDFDRRAFFRLIGGGIAVFVTLGPEELFAQGRRSYPEDLNAYLLIGADGRVTVFTGKIEMGQGVMTSQAQMVADELGVALESIDMVMGDTDRCPWDMGTFGSLTTRMFGPVLRAAAAEARLVLLGLAAKQLGAVRGDLEITEGVVSVAGEPTRRVTFGELARGRRLARLVGEKAVLRQVKEFAVMGRSPERLDARVKVTGAAQYAGDIRRPGMLCARILRPPAHGAKLRGVDTSAAEALPGVRVVRDGELVAVLHPQPDGAAAALAALRAEWDSAPAGPDAETIFAHLRSAAGEPQVVDQRGDPEGFRSRAGEAMVAATFHKGYVAHAPIEPHTAVAEWAGDRMTVWASTQTPFPTRSSVAAALGLDEDKVRVITPYVGGGFGGKSAHRQAVEAARLARAAGVPVQVAWTRQEEFFHDTFDPACVVEAAAALDEAAKIIFWSYDVWAAGARSAEVIYDVPNVRIRSFGGRMSGAEQREAEPFHPFAVGPWRAPGANMNVFARESLIDILAARAQVDPLELRLKNLTDSRMRRVLEACAAAFGWRAVPAARTRRGRGRGVACGIDAGTYVALMAEVEVDRESGRLRVERVVCAQDMGIVVNPDGARMQVEGCVTMGLGYALAEELRFEGGRILDTNFDSYELPRFSWVPKIEAVLVDHPELDPQGGGEPAIVPMGAVLANALFDATGARLFRLPLTAGRVREALAGQSGAAAEKGG
ncbi:MAG: molybdopterin-dependent oxidoreductase [Thermoanaerobaculia bacterium]|nr:molybdopterin-dependent oxidoreductase [Thermoanaerobaculia bacterium]